MKSTEEEDRKDSRHQDNFPRRLAFSVWIVQFYNGIQYSEIFTLAVYVVRGFEGPNATEQRIGQLAGLLAAASSFSVGLAAWPWGLFSDRVGRKAVVLFGNCSTATCIVLFSLSRQYWAALLFRFMAGFLDGSLVMTKVMVGESCTPHMQAKVMGMLALGDAMGNIVGPSLGGLLADPCSRFLNGSIVCQGGSWLAQYPYLLPCGLTACLGFLTTIINIFFMEETLPRLKGLHTHSSKSYALLDDADRNSQEDAPPKTPNALSRALTSPDSVAMSECISEAIVDMHRQESEQWASSPGAERENEGESLETEHAVCEGAGSLLGKRSEVELQARVSRVSNWPDETEEEHLDVRWQDSSRNSDRSSHSSEDLGGEQRQLLPLRKELNSKLETRSSAATQSGEGDQRWWRNRSLMLTIIVTAWMLSIAKYNDELGPIFVSAPVKQGGLGMPLSSFAAPLAFGGVVLTAFALFGYPALQRAVGLKTTCSLGLLVGIPGDLLLPCAALVQSRPILMQAVIYIAIAITKLTTQTAFTSSMVIINSLAPRSQLGSVNGIRMMAAALGRSSGPILGGVLWGLSASLHFPGHHFLAFIVPSLALVGCWFLHHQIPIDL